MRRKKIYDPYAEAIDKFNQRKVKYVVVGMTGINYYASNARETFATQDFDILIAPTIDNVKKAVLILRSLGYLIDEHKAEDLSIKDMVKHKRTILAADAYGITIELILTVSGFTFNQMARDATIFMVSRIPVKVAQLSKLLASKKIAGRRKDKFFIKRYEILLKEKSR